MATPAASMGTPQPKKPNQANLTAARAVMTSRPSKPKQQRRQPSLGLSAAQLGAAGTRAGQQQYGGPQMRGWGAPAQYPGGLMTGFPGNQPSAPQYPGQTNWWQQRPQMPPAQNWGSPQFNYMGGYAPSATPGAMPPWGGGLGNRSPFQPSSQAGYGGSFNPFTAGLATQPYQTGGRPPSAGISATGQHYGGMPAGGMPSYGVPSFSNTALPQLQQQSMWQQYMNMLPGDLRKYTQFGRATGELGIDPSTLQGYGTEWGYSPTGWGGSTAPWQSTWGRQAPTGAPPGGQMGGMRQFGPPRVPRGGFARGGRRW